MKKSDLSVEKPSPPVSRPAEPQRMKKFDMAALQIQPRLSVLANAVYPLRLPGSQEFFQVNPDDSFVASFELLEDKGAKDGKKIFIVHPDLADDVAGDSFSAEVRLAVNQASEYFLIYCKYPPREGEPCTTTRINIVEQAQKSWMRMRYVNNNVGYEGVEAGNNTRKPVWPRKSFMEILETSASEYVITDSNHYLIRRLRGDE